MIVDRILIVSIVINKICSLFKKLLLLLLLLELERDFGLNNMPNDLILATPMIFHEHEGRQPRLQIDNLIEVREGRSLSTKHEDRIIKRRKS